MKFAYPFCSHLSKYFLFKKEASFLFALNIFYVPFPGLQISVLVFLRLLRRCGCCLELWGGVEIPSAEGLHLVFLLRHRHLQGSDKGRLRHSKGSPLVGASTEAPLAIQAEGAATTEEKEPKLNSPSELGEKANGKNTTVMFTGFFPQCPFLHLLCFPSFILSLILRPTPLPNFPQRPRLLRRPGFPPPPPPVCASTSSRSTWSSGDSTLRPPPPPSSTHSACGLPRTRWCHSCHRRRRRSLELEHRTERILTVPRRG